MQYFIILNENNSGVFKTMKHIAYDKNMKSIRNLSHYYFLFCNTSVCLNCGLMVHYMLS